MGQRPAQLIDWAGQGRLLVCADVERDLLGRQRVLRQGPAVLRGELVRLDVDGICRRVVDALGPDRRFLYGKVDRSRISLDVILSITTILCEGADSLQRPVNGVNFAEWSKCGMIRRNVTALRWSLGPCRHSSKTIRISDLERHLLLSSENAFTSLPSSRRF